MKIAYNPSQNKVGVAAGMPVNVTTRMLAQSLPGLERF
jgi:hypothetical protein